MTRRDFEKDRKSRISKTRGAEYVYSNFDGCLPPSNKQTAKKKLGKKGNSVRRNEDVFKNSLAAMVGERAAKDYLRRRSR